jgi:putative membrane protein
LLIPEEVKSTARASRAKYGARRRPIFGGWLFLLVTCVCLAIRATYELFQWLMAVISGSAAMAFLGTQGDVWDTQRDMPWALIGAVTSQLVLARRHDRELAALPAIGAQNSSPAR